MGIIVSISAAVKKLWPAESEAVQFFPEGIYLISKLLKPHLGELFGAQNCWHAAESTQNLICYLRSICVKLC